MKKVQVSVRPIRKEISKLEKKLRAVRRRVPKAEKKKIDFDLRLLKKANKIIREICFLRTFPTVK